MSHDRRQKCLSATMLGILLVAGHPVLLAAGEVPAPAPFVSASTPEEAGRYLVILGGCNDCHTANWPESGGAIPEQEWLTGSMVGFRGPWGTSYASNLRLLAQEMDEAGWVSMLRHRNGLPPMPWVNMKLLNDSDARAIYRYIRSLGAQGTRAPTAVPPGVEPLTPYIPFEPQHLERMQGGDTQTL